MNGWRKRAGWIAGCGLVAIVLQLLAAFGHHHSPHIRQGWSAALIAADIEKQSPVSPDTDECCPICRWLGTLGASAAPHTTDIAAPVAYVVATAAIETERRPPGLAVETIRSRGPPRI